MLKTIFFLVTLYNNHCQPIQEFKADTVTVLRIGYMRLDRDSGETTEFDLTTDVSEVKIQAGAMIQYLRLDRGIWTEFNSSSCNQV